MISTRAIFKIILYSQGQNSLSIPMDCVTQLLQLRFIWEWILQPEQTVLSSLWTSVKPLQSISALHSSCSNVYLGRHSFWSWLSSLNAPKFSNGCRKNIHKHNKHANYLGSKTVNNFSYGKLLCCLKVTSTMVPTSQEYHPLCYICKLHH